MCGLPSLAEQKFFIKRKHAFLFLIDAAFPPCRTGGPNSGGGITSFQGETAFVAFP